MLAQEDCLGTKGMWIENKQEYYLEIQPTKLVKGKGISQLMDEGNEEALGMKDLALIISVVVEEMEAHDLYADIVYYLRNI